MARFTVSVEGLGALAGALRRVGRFLSRLALAGALGAAAIAAHLLDDGVTAGDVVATLLLLVPAGIVLLLAQGVRELIALPERIRRMPAEGQQRVAELGRIAGAARSTRLRGTPLLLWRLRGAVGSLRGVAGLALPLRVFAPGFLALAAFAGLLCVVLAGAGLVALVLLVA